MNLFNVSIHLAGVDDVVSIKQSLAKLLSLGESIMSAISDFANKQTQFNIRQAAAVDSLVSSFAGVKDDIDGLNAKILELQNSSGPVTPQDQVLLDELQAQGEAIAAKTESVAASLKSLDEATPPVIPAG